MDAATLGQLKAVSVGTRLLRRRSGCMSTATAIRVGSDVLSVHQGAESVARFGDRYLERIYAEQEISSDTGSAPVRAKRLPLEVPPGLVKKRETSDG
jgi:hypothetical protein